MRAWARSAAAPPPRTIFPVKNNGMGPSAAGWLPSQFAIANYSQLDILCLSGGGRWPWTQWIARAWNEDGTGPRGTPSLSEVFGSIATRPSGSFWRKLVTFLGPGYLVAVGYMDPGNWATSLAGGSKFGYALLTVALLSNLMAILLQALCARLGIGAGRDLAQACRDAFPRWASWPLWIITEIAICATDLAEVIGTAIGLNLLFGVPLEIGVLITALDVFLILWMQNLGFRWVEAFIVTLLGVIAICFGIQIALANPNGAR